jgi:peptidoglycan/LPS O-acetylase OafA/YrhL
MLVSLAESTTADCMHSSIPGYRRDIDGLRAIAVTSVVLYHAGVPLIRSGFAGADDFFVISGFLIGQIVYRDLRREDFRFETFYLRRIRRIVPALLVVVLATLLAGAAILSASELKDASWSAVSALLGVSNMHFWATVSYFTPDASLDPLLMTWTLGVEEHFYLLLPLVLLGLRRFSPNTNLAAIFILSFASLIASVVLTVQAPRAAFYLIPSRAWELGTGVMLAIWVLSKRPLPQGIFADTIGMVALSCLFGSLCLLGNTFWPGLAAILPVAASAALLSTRESAVNRLILSTRFLVGIGLISYSWYLWHWPIFTFESLSSVLPPSGHGSCNGHFLAGCNRIVALCRAAVSARTATRADRADLVSGRFGCGTFRTGYFSGDGRFAKPTTRPRGRHRSSGREHPFDALRKLPSRFAKQMCGVGTRTPDACNYWRQPSALRSRPSQRLPIGVLPCLPKRLAVP